MTRVRYPAEFKAEAVKQVTERGHGVVDAAKRLGMPARDCAMRASEIGEDALSGCKSTAMSMNRGLISWRLKPSIPLPGVQHVNAASTVSFGHHP